MNKMINKKAGWAKFNHGSNNIAGPKYRAVLTLTVAAVTFFAASTSVKAVPYTGNEFTYYQPDGEAIQVRLYGDEFYAVAETLDGHVIVQDPVTREFQYAELSADGNEFQPTGIRVGKLKMQGTAANTEKERIGKLKKKQRIKHESRAKKADEMRKRLGRDNDGRIVGFQPASGGTSAPAGAAAVAPAAVNGNRVTLVLLAKFPDRAADVTLTQTQVNNCFNAVPYTDINNATSVKGYYRIQSNNKLELSSVVTAYFTAKYNRSYYTDPAIGYGTRARELIIEGLEVLKSKSFNFAQLDGDNDGRVDAVSCMYAGSAVNNWAEGLWPHCSSLTWAGFSAAGKSTSVTYQITDLGNTLAIGTTCHELGHAVIGLPDLYSYDGNAANVGDFCLMSGGNWASGGRHPTSICGPLKYDAGWTTVQNATASTVATYNLSVDQNQVVRFANPANSGEYFMAEVRLGSGYEGPYGGDTASVCPSPGLVLFHYLSTGSNPNSTIFTRDNPHCNYSRPYRHLLIERNPTTAYTPWYDAPSPDGNDAFTTGSVDSSNLKFWSASGRTVASGANINSISVSGSSLSFKIGAGPGAAGLLAEFFDYTTDLSVLPDLAGKTPNVTRTDAQINYPSTDGTAWTGLPSSMIDTFVSRHTGQIKIPTAGSYTFYLSSDDGSKMWLDGSLLINNDGLHGMVEVSATRSLSAGNHDVRIEFFENYGGAGLVLSWAGPGIAKQVVPASALVPAEPGLWYGTATGDINTTAANPKTKVTASLSETEDAIADNTTEIYSGQIFDADGHISFTEDIDDRTRLYIDGSLVISSDNWADRISTADLNLAPGWHNFELRISNGGGGSGPHTAPGFGYDPNGGTNWRHPADPGDGSLFRARQGSAPPVNTPPVANAQSVTTAQNTAKAITLTGSDPDGDALTYAIVASPAHGILSGTAPSVTYTPTTGYSGSDSFAFKVTDSKGAASANATVSITVTAVNRAPVANAQSVTTVEDAAKAITLTGSDPDGDALTYTIVTLPVYGTLTGSGAAQTYTPAANYYGSDSFVFKVTDSKGASSGNATVSITVTAVNDAPVANAQSASTVQNTAKAITLTGSDVDGDSLTYAIVTSPAHGTLSGTGANKTYTPATGYTGSDSFTFKVTDSKGASSANATVSITVTAASGGPAGYTWCANENGTYVFNSTVDVAYGANGSFYYKYGVSGSITFNNATFGDPAPNVPKSGYYRAVGTAQPGLLAEFFDYTTALSVLPDLTGKTPGVIRTDAQINYPGVATVWSGLPAGMVDTFVSRHIGQIRINTAGSYTFYLSSDDGSKMWLDGALLINNDGLHGMVEVSKTVTLTAGTHMIRVEFFENDGNAGLILNWAGPGIAKQVVPSSVLSSLGKNETVWVDDAAPAGATLYGTWNWITTGPVPYSGKKAHRESAASGTHQHYFENATETLSVGAGGKLFCYVYIDPASKPSEVMLQWNNGSWEHRAYWGANNIGWGTDGTVSRRYMGALPTSGQWVRLEVPASLVGLENTTVRGMAFTLYNGSAVFDRAGAGQ
ncbi:MAG: Ig-like domain-containing protein [Pontiellaceae bacterium]|nr:Ig-like domain-containing protein [Pontiellaceae bacterium]